MFSLTREELEGYTVVYLLVKFSNNVNGLHLTGRCELSSVLAFAGVAVEHRIIRACRLWK